MVSIGVHDGHDAVGENVTNHARFHYRTATVAGFVEATYDEVTENVAGAATEKRILYTGLSRNCAPESGS
jgi:hypothetical protein